MNCSTCGAPVAAGAEPVTVSGWYAFGHAAWGPGPKLHVSPYCAECLPGARLVERLQCGNPPHEGLTGRACRGGLKVTRWDDGRESAPLQLTVAQAERALEVADPAMPDALWRALQRAATT
ncbi:hypothetical protein [Myxococcus xanthus]|uniref:hypothetical protein n=1 Tax=Myxococcus xanthus TaxID=34 RepID=UPI00112714A3|nr:hypothetical protein [Myxococcus xanthus]QDE83334.1 hypothetical protein BHS07_18195 [Myxococcus xanthus]